MYELNFENPVLDELEDVALIAIKKVRAYLENKAPGSDETRVASMTIGQYQRLHASVNQKAQTQLIAQKLNSDNKKRLPAPKETNEKKK